MSHYIASMPFWKSILNEWRNDSLTMLTFIEADQILYPGLSVPVQSLSEYGIPFT